jgi:hypothetical protein
VHPPRGNFRRVLSIPQNIVMAMNNVMLDLLTFYTYYYGLKISVSRKYYGPLLGWFINV